MKNHAGEGTRAILPQRLEQMAFHPVSDPRKVFPGELQEVWSSAVGFEGGIVLVLLVDKESAGFGLVPMHLVHGTARFLAGLLSQFFKQCGNFDFVPNFRHPGNRQHHHRALLPHGPRFA